MKEELEPDRRFVKIRIFYVRAHFVCISFGIRVVFVANCLSSVLTKKTSSTVAIFTVTVFQQLEQTTIRNKQTRIDCG